MRLLQQKHLQLNLLLRHSLQEEGPVKTSLLVRIVDLSIMTSATSKPNPKWFFCAQCDAWDSDKLVVPRIKPTSLRCKCIAGHLSFAFPTTQIPKKGMAVERPKCLSERIRRLQFEDSGSAAVDLERAAGSDSEAPVEPLLPEVDPSTCAIEQLRSTVASLQLQNDRLRAEGVKDKRRV